MYTGRIIPHIAAGLFGLGVRGRTSLYRRGIVKSKKVQGIGVISIGNLAMGGSGKTPFAMYLAEALNAAGQRVAVVLRGYGGTEERSGAVVSEGNGPLLDVHHAGDEAFMMARRLDGVSVRIGADRYRAVCAAKEAGATVAILDDGFQHLRIHRDLDILLAAPDHLAPDARLFPEGALRDLPETAGRADLIGGFESDWQGARSTDPDFTFELSPDCIEDAWGDRHPLTLLRDEKVHLLCGIGVPERFEKTVRRLGGMPVGSTRFRDHHVFTAKELRHVRDEARRERAAHIVTTEKDWVRIPEETRRAEPPIAALIAAITITKGARTLMQRVEHALGT